MKLRESENLTKFLIDLDQAKISAQKNSDDLLSIEILSKFVNDIQQNDNNVEAAKQISLLPAMLVQRAIKNKSKVLNDLLKSLSLAALIAEADKVIADSKAAQTVAVASTNPFDSVNMPTNSTVVSTNPFDPVNMVENTSTPVVQTNAESTNPFAKNAEAPTTSLSKKDSERKVKAVSFLVTKDKVERLTNTHLDQMSKLGELIQKLPMDAKEQVIAISESIELISSKIAQVINPLDGKLDDADKNGQTDIKLARSFLKDYSPAKSIEDNEKALKNTGRALKEAKDKTDINNPEFQNLRDFIAGNNDQTLETIDVTIAEIGAILVNNQNLSKEEREYLCSAHLFLTKYKKAFDKIEKPSDLESDINAITDKKDQYQSDIELKKKLVKQNPANVLLRASNAIINESVNDQFTEDTEAHAKQLVVKLTKLGAIARETKDQITAAKDQLAEKLSNPSTPQAVANKLASLVNKKTQQQELSEKLFGVYLNAIDLQERIEGFAKLVNHDFIAKIKDMADQKSLCTPEEIKNMIDDIRAQHAKLVTESRKLSLDLKELEGLDVANEFSKLANEKFDQLARLFQQDFKDFKSIEQVLLYKVYEAAPKAELQAQSKSIWAIIWEVIKSAFTPKPKVDDKKSSEQLHLLGQFKHSTATTSEQGADENNKISVAAAAC